LLAIGGCLLLSVAVGFVCYATPISFRDLGRIIPQMIGMVSSSPAGRVGSQSILRGTIYDRNFSELSVSYQLFSLYAHPAKVYNHAAVAEKLAAIIGGSKEAIVARFSSSRRVVELATNLDGGQVGNIEALHLAGIYCRGTEKRFYPEHTVAASVLGYTIDGVGITGLERKYDLLLQPGEYQASAAPGVALPPGAVMGKKGTDLILTLDLRLQKALDQQLRKLCQKDGATLGMGLLLEPTSGRVLAYSRQPSYDPNYFWKSDEKGRRSQVDIPRFDPQLLRPLLLRAAATMRGGEQFSPLLPATIAAKDFGLGVQEYRAFCEQIGFSRPVAQGKGGAESLAGADFSEQKGSLSLMQLGVGLAGLINGGWKVKPFFVDSVYDRQRSQRFRLQKELVARTRIFPPAMGVAVRREVLNGFSVRGKREVVALSGQGVRIVDDGAMRSHYVQQQIFVGMVPRKRPTMLLVMALDQQALAPRTKGDRFKKHILSSVGSTLLDDAYGMVQEEAVATYPDGKNKDNFARFLIGSRVGYTPAPGSTVALSLTMPPLVGMSLRKGLQQLNRYHVEIAVRGSGRIVEQHPRPGERLREGGRCLLTLDEKI